MCRPSRLVLSKSEFNELKRLQRGRPPRDRIARRARIVLAAARGSSIARIARQVGAAPETVVRWRQRFRANGIAGLTREAPRAGSRHRIPGELVERILAATVDGAPRQSGAGWSTRSLARTLGTNHMAVHRVWRRFGLYDRVRGPEKSETGSRPRVDLVGTYLGDEAATLAFAVMPGIPSRPRHSPTPPAPVRSRNRTVEPRLSSELLSWIRHRGTVRRPPRCRSPTTSPALLVWLRSLEEGTPPSARLDLVIDRGMEEMGARWAAWLEQHPRFRVYPVPQSEGWARATEAWLDRWSQTPLDPRSFRNASAFRAVTVSGGRDRRTAVRLPFARPRGGLSRRRPGPPRATTAPSPSTGGNTSAGDGGFPALPTVQAGGRTEALCNRSQHSR